VTHFFSISHSAERSQSRSRSTVLFLVAGDTHLVYKSYSMTPCLFYEEKTCLGDVEIACVLGSERPTRTRLTPHSGQASARPCLTR
jgi:hypothetical protein